MTDPPSSPTYRFADGVAVVTLDDGKANAISHAVIDGLHAALDQAEADEARALLLVGREGKFSAGFDLPTMTESLESMRALVTAGARLQMRIYGLGMPTIAACTGHALAAGALMLLVSDHRVGADLPAKIGLNEVAIGMALPIFAVELARDRLTPREFGPATMQARIYDPAGAVDAGYLDRVVPVDRLLDEAMADAARLAEIRTGAYARTKLVARQATIDHVLSTVEADMASVTGPDGAT
ncbi:MAG: Enoyl-CoA hydratase/isomerase [Acidimicrobiales bacterium]|nr:Enoyl-CoA hydratase/isomerase [Acidimicrobiales bacterium]